MNRVRLMAVVLSGLACLLIGAALDAQPVPKKLIEYGWDVPAPSYVAANICRRRSGSGGTEHSSWSRCVTGFQEPGRFGVWTLR